MLITCLFIQPWYTLRLSKIPWRGYLQQSMTRPALVSLLVAPCAWLLRWSLPAKNLFWLALVVAIESTLFLGLAFVIALDRFEQGMVKQYAIGVFHKIRNTPEYEAAN